jgi:Tol biopolymer transport system component
MRSAPLFLVASLVLAASLWPVPLWAGSPSSDTAPAWSPDGTRAVFISYRTGHGDLYLVNADGSGRRRLTYTAAAEFDRPTWSPDGHRIAFVRAEGNTEAIYTTRPDGGGQRRLYRSCYVGAPAWSPDGTRIAFEGGCPPYASIYAVDVGTGRARRLTPSTYDDSTSTGTEDGYPTWSPDSKMIAFDRLRRSHADVSYLGIALMLSDGSHQHELGSSDETQPAWSPDGRRIAVERSGILLINTAGHTLKRLTAGDDEHPAWAPNGKKIIFDRNIGKGVRKLFTVNATGGPAEQFGSH